MVLAGYLKLIPPGLVRAFKRRILNIHPALLPAFGGKGYYGGKVGCRRRRRRKQSRWGAALLASRAAGLLWWVWQPLSLAPSHWAPPSCWTPAQVHRAVVASGARFSGPTIHFVDEEYDTGGFGSIEGKVIIVVVGLSTCAGREAQKDRAGRKC